MARIDKYYRNLLFSIFEQGYVYQDTKRDVECKQISSVNMVLPLEEEFPLLTTKKMFTKGIVGELIWFLRGNSSIKYLVENGINIWNKDALNYLKSQTGAKDLSLEDFVERVKSDNLRGDVGANYGMQWRSWIEAGEPHFDELVPVSYLDQISTLLENLILHPMSRRHIVTAWNPSELDKTALPPCHWSFEVIVKPLAIFERIKLVPLYSEQVDLERMWSEEKFDEIKTKLSEKQIPEYGFTLKWHQRSVDTFLGLPFNIASYALLAHILEGLTGYKALMLIGDLSNVHIYQPHMEACKTQLKRSSDKYEGVHLKFSEKVKENFTKFRNLEMNFSDFISDFEISDVSFPGYESYDSIPAEMLEPKK